MSTIEAKKALSVLKPEIKTKYLRNLLMEKVRYLEVPKHLSVEDLKRDIKNGAVHLKELPGLLEKKNDPKYIIITAENEEQGFLAVSYLAAGFNSKAEDFIDCLDDEPVGTDIPEMPEIAVEDAEQDDPEYDEERWEENDMMIPIISISELMDSQSPHSNNMPYYFNNYQIDQQNRNLNQHRHFWQDCTTRSVCITTGYTFNDLGMNDTDQMFGALEYFQDNKKIYILHIRSGAGDFCGIGGFGCFDDDFEFPDNEGALFLDHDGRLRNQIILNFSADDVKVVLEKDDQKRYFKEVLRSHIVKNGMGTVKGFSYEKIVRLILAMHNDKTNDLVEKIFRYAMKDRDLEPGYLFRNEDFAFIDRFARTADKKKSGGGRSAKERLMQDLVGMEDVKQQVMDVVNMLKFNKLRAGKGIQGSQYHNVHVMLGAPGTAKTTVAKLMGQIMVEEKLLRDDRFICVNGAELKGMYVGHSAPKTKSLFDNHDIILIDEAYSLIDSSGTADCFSNEALAQMVIELENHADDRLVIFAGYGGVDVAGKDNRMKLFLDANPGIKSRINSTFFFASYSAEDMLNIFLRIAKNEHYRVQPGAEEEIKGYFESRRTERDFGNGREARSLLEGSLVAMARRLFDEKGDKKITAEDMKLIRTSDIRQAIDRAVTANDMQRGCLGKAIGFCARR